MTAMYIELGDELDGVPWVGLSRRTEDRLIDRAGDRLGLGTRDGVGIGELDAGGVYKIDSDRDLAVAAGQRELAATQRANEKKGGAAQVLQEIAHDVVSGRSKPLAPGTVSLEATAKTGDVVGVHLLPEPIEAVLPIDEMAFEVDLGDAGALDDHLDRGRLIAMLGDEGDQRLADALALQLAVAGSIADLLRLRVQGSARSQWSGGARGHWRVGKCAAALGRGGLVAWLLA